MRHFRCGQRHVYSNPILEVEASLGLSDLSVGRFAAPIRDSQHSGLTRAPRHHIFLATLDCCRNSATITECTY